MKLKAIEARQIACESALEMMKKHIEDTAERGLQRYVQWHSAGDEAVLYTKAELEAAGYKVVCQRNGAMDSYYWIITW